MAIQDEWAISYGAKTVTHSSGTTVYTTLAFFQWLANTFAAASQMDDDYPIQSDTPTVFKFLNGWYFGDPATDYKFLKGGSIASDDGNELFSNLYSIGSQFRDSFIYVVQNDAELSPWWSAGNIDVLIKVKTGGSLIDGGNVLVMSRDSDGVYDHNFVDLSGGGRNPVGINTFADLNYNDTGDLYLDVASVVGFDIGNYVKGVTSNATARINYIDLVNGYLYLVMEEGGPFQVSETINETLVRGGAGTGTTTTNSGTTAEFDAVRGYAEVIPVHIQRKFSGGTTSNGPFIAGETVTQTGTGAVFLFGAEASAVLYVQNVSGSPNGTGQLTGGTSGALYTPTSTTAETSISLNLNNGDGAQPYNVVVQCGAKSMKQVYQYLKYLCRHNSSATLNGDTGEEYRSANEAGYVDSKQAPYGTFAGGTFFGARGVWPESYAAATFQLTDADGDLQLPPNYQKVTVSHTNLTGCYTFVAEISGGNIIKDQYTIQSVTSDSITVTVSIDINKTPQSGVLRIGDLKYTYASFNGQVFSGVSPDPTGKTGGLYVPLLDLLADAATELSDNVIYGTPVNVRAVVRKYGYKPFTQDTVFGSSGLAFSPILTPDPQAT
jgi:hypothetical protein